MLLNVVIGLAAAIAILTFPVLLRCPLERFGPRASLSFALGWLAALIALDVAFGANTYSAINEELEAGIATHLAWIGQPPGVGWSHSIGGGVDLSATTALLGQYLSLDVALMRLVSSVLSLSAANIVQKLLMASLAYVGAYSLCRKANPSGYLVPAMAAATFTLSDYYMAVIGWQTHGYALIPLTVHVLVFRTASRLYWIEVVAISLIYASSCLVTHTTLGLFGAVLAACLITDRPRLGRIVPAFFILVAGLVANWHEQLWGLVQMAPFASRSLETNAPYFIEPMSNTPLFMAMAVSGVLMVLLCGERRYGLRALAALAVIFFLGYAVETLVGSTPALAPLAPIRWGRINISLFTIAPLLLAWGAEQLGAHGRPRLCMSAWRVTAAACCACVIYLFVWNKTYRVLEWLSEGGLTSLTATLPQLQDHPWYPTDEPVRVLTVPYRVTTYAAPLAGLDAIDGFVNLSVRPLNVFLHRAGYKTLGHQLDYKCCASYDIDGFLNLDALRLLNVGFIISVLPLEGPHITQVAGPTGPMAIPRAHHDWLTRLRGFAHLIGHHPGLRVYALERPNPRVYAAHRVILANEDASDPQLADSVVQGGVSRDITVRPSALPEGTAARPSLTVDSFRLEPEAIEVRVTAPDGGIVVVNVPHLPFWHAEADGKPTGVFPANLAQMAILVPKDASLIRLTYHRPSLKESLKMRWDRRSGASGQ